MFDEIRNKANLARDVDLEEVLTHIECIKDRSLHHSSFIIHHLTLTSAGG